MQMKTLYLSCEMGAAGDMLMAALYELLPDKAAFLQTMNGLLPGVTLTAEDSVKCGIHGTHMRVIVHGHEEEAGDAHPHAHDHQHTHSHHHRSLQDILALIAQFDLPEPVRTAAATVYRRIAAAESRIHGTAVGEVHFHEVGALDAVADVTGVCLALHLLQPDRILCSPVNVGSGTVRCAHGELPVPAPATVLLLQDVPIYSGSVRSELCTPTGAALLAKFASFGEMPVLRPERCGIGMGSKDFPVCNCLRAFWENGGNAPEEVLELRCELDDMTPEELGFAREQLEAAGALDVYTLPADMKKNRPGVLLTCLVREEARDRVLRAIFRHTTTLGVRESRCRRWTLERRMELRDTPMGLVRYKTAQGWGVAREKAEFEDLAAAARAAGRSLREVRELCEKR